MLEENILKLYPTYLIISRKNRKLEATAENDGSYLVFKQIMYLFYHY